MGNEWIEQLENPCNICEVKFGEHPCDLVKKILINRVIVERPYPQTFEINVPPRNVIMVQCSVKNHISCCFV